MDALLDWVTANWFLVLQGAGIIGGLLFTGLSLRRESRARRVSDLLTLTEQHRELWNEGRCRPELARVFQGEGDLVGQPVSAHEEAFLNEVIVHFNTGWLLAREGSLLSLAALANDVQAFFRLPIPRVVWQKTRLERDPKFVRFVEKQVGRPH